MMMSRTLPTSARFKTLSATASGFLDGDAMLFDLCLDMDICRFVRTVGWMNWELEDRVVDS